MRLLSQHHDSPVFSQIFLLTRSRFVKMDSNRNQIALIEEDCFTPEMRRFEKNLFETILIKYDFLEESFQVGK